MSKSAIAKQLLALAEKLGTTEPKAEQFSERDRLASEIEDLETKLSAVTPVGDEINEADAEIEEWADELTNEGEGGVVTDEAEEIQEEEIQEVEESTGIEDVDFDGEDQNTKVSTEENQDVMSDEDEDIGVEASEEDVDNAMVEAMEEVIPAADQGVENTIKQPLDVVEQLMGVEDEGEFGLDVVENSTSLNDSELRYASCLKEASTRLDAVSAALETRGQEEKDQKWMKFAFRLDTLSDAIDSERKDIAIRVGKRVAKQSGLTAGKSIVASLLS